MTNEEIQLKLGLDATQFSTGLRTMQRETEAATEHAHKSFLHAQSSARGFHKVLEQLNETVPGFGTLISGLSNPLTAIFTGSAALIAVAREKLKEFNAEMDRQGAEAAKPIWSREQMISLKNEIADAHKEYKDFLKSLQPSKVTAEVEAIGGEKDETKRVAQARRFQDRIAAERDAALKERDRLDKEVDGLKTEKAKIPIALEATRKFAEEQKKVPIFKKFRSIDPAGGVHDIETNERDFEAEEKREIQLESLIRRMEARKEENAERVRQHTERRKEIESSVSEKQKAIDELNKIRESGEMSELEEAFTFPKGRRGSGSASFGIMEDIRQNRIPHDTVNAAQKTHELGELMRKWDSHGVPMQPKMGE